MKRFRVILPFVALLCSAATAAAQERIDSFGVRYQGGPYQSDVYVTNDSCPGTHSVQLTVQGAPWYRITGQNPVRVPDGQTEFVQAFLDLTKQPPGKYTGTLLYQCLDCSASCKQSVTSQPLSVEVIPRTADIPRALITGPFDQFGGIVNNTAPNICIVIQNILKDLEMTAWGKTPRAQKIIERLRLRYTGSNCAGMKFVGHEEVPNEKGQPQKTVEPGEEQPEVDNAVYVHDPSLFRDHKIFVGLDQRITSIQSAIEDPTSYFLFTHNGKLGVAKKSELVHVLIHEGLHATQAGEFNVDKPVGGGRGASLEEERDGANAGNEACRALGYPTTEGDPGKGYNAGPNPAYKPLQ